MRGEGDHLGVVDVGPDQGAVAHRVRLQVRAGDRGGHGHEGVLGQPALRAAGERLDEVGLGRGREGELGDLADGAAVGRIVVIGLAGGPAVAEILAGRDVGGAVAGGLGAVLLGAHALTVARV